MQKQYIYTFFVAYQDGYNEHVDIEADYRDEAFEYLATYLTNKDVMYAKLIAKA